MAGSATITGTQNYIMGIGHPKTEATTEAPPSVFATNPLTGVMAMVASAGTFAINPGPRAVLWGDSLAANFEAANSNNYFTTSYGQYAVAFRYLNQRLNLVYNGGVSGERTDEILARFSTIQAQNPGVILMSAGINDIHQDIPVQTIIQNLKALIFAALSTGAIVCIPTIHLTTVMSTSARKSAMFVVNKYLRSIAFTERVIVGNNYAALVDSAGVIVTNALADGTHMSPLGADRSARMWAELLSVAFPPCRTMISSILDGANITDNGAMSGSNASGTNGFTLGTAQLGVGPNNWALQRTGSALISTGSKVARTDWKAGEGMRITIGTGGATGDRIQFSQNIQFRLRAQNVGYSVNKRIYVPATGAQYQVTATGNTANTSDPSAGWSKDIGATITDGTLSLVCVQPVTAGALVQGEFEYAISSLAVGQVNPQIKIYFKDTAGTSLLQLSGNLYSGVEGSLPPSLPTATGVVRTGVPQAVPETFDLSTTTTSAGPQIETLIELWTVGGATCVFDVFAASVTAQ